MLDDHFLHDLNLNNRGLGTSQLPGLSPPVSRVSSAETWGDVRARRARSGNNGKPRVWPKRKTHSRKVVQADKLE